MDPTRQALEANLADHPDDLVAHAAYADWLIENDDSRGEYIREALALQDRTIPKRERTRRARLLVQYAKAHEKEWLGPLHKFVKLDWWPLEVPQIGPRGSTVGVRVPIGWIQSMMLTYPNARLWTPFLECHLARLVQHLKIIPSHFKTVRDPAGWVEHLSRFPGLHSLDIRLRRFVDKGVDRLLASDIVSQLTDLQLCGCGITDVGALAMANDPRIRELKFLDLSWNYISPIGRGAFADIGFDIGHQHVDYPN